MKSDGIFKQAIAVFIVALAAYIVAYRAIEDRRTRNGPWQIAFTNDAAGIPALVIDQPKLAITNVMINFPEATGNRPTNFAALDLTQPRAVPFNVPFGQCIFMDTTSLPGTIVLEIFGHEIQLLPRVLTVDKVEHPWRAGAQLTLTFRPIAPSP